MATPAEPKTADNFDPEKAENLEDVRDPDIKELTSRHANP